MSLRRWVVIGVVGTALAVLSGVVTARAMRPVESRDSEAKSHSPSVRISEAELHFGDVWEQQDFVWPITVVNMSDTVKEITGMAGSCSCQTISPRQYTLQPGESRRVEVRLDLRANGSQAVAVPVDNFAVAIWATVKGEPKDIHWKLTGRVMHAVRCPDRLDLGRISELAPEKGAIEFGVHPLVELSRFRIVPGAAWVRTELKRVGVNYTVKVIPESGLKQQDYATKIEFELVHADGQELPGLTIPVRFRACNEISVESISQLPLRISRDLA